MCRSYALRLDAKVPPTGFHKIIFKQTNITNGKGEGTSKKNEAEMSNIMRGMQYCDSLFSIENEISNLPLEEWLRKREDLAEPILKEFHDWVFRLNYAPNSLLGKLEKVVQYTRKCWHHLLNYLQDGRLEISNNRAERSIKLLVMGRKNFLFANVPKGAEASAIIYSLVETAKENALDPYRYLTWLRHEAPKMNLSVEDQVAGLLPINALEECRVVKGV